MLSNVTSFGEINIYLGFLHIFDWVCFVVVIELCVLFLYVGTYTLVHLLVCKYFLPVHRLSFPFIDGSLSCPKSYVWLGLICLFLLLFVLPWETDFRETSVQFMSGKIFAFVLFKFYGVVSYN